MGLEDGLTHSSRVLYSLPSLLRVTKDMLVGNGMRTGHACTIMSLITDLKLAMGVREPRKWNSDSFSDYAYLLTSLPSFKISLLVRFFSNFQLCANHKWRLYSSLVYD